MYLEKVVSGNTKAERGKEQIKEKSAAQTALESTQDKALKTENAGNIQKSELFPEVNDFPAFSIHLKYKERFVKSYKKM